MTFRDHVLARIERWQADPHRPRGTCRFEPTCSLFAHEAISRQGLVRGGGRTLWRVVRCHPWSRGGYDPV